MKAKRLLSPVIMLLLATLIMAVIPTEAEGAVYGDTLRLHIPANSDTEADQKIKLEIRDKILGKYSADLSRFSSANEAAEELSKFTEEVESDVCLWLSEGGFDYGCTVTVCEEWFDTREYDGITLPAGEYRALKVTLGEGCGQNWWCVMYPPMCLGVATSTPQVIPEYSDAEYRLVKSGRYSVRFKILEIISECCREVSKKG